MKIAMIGAGYVGLTTGACLASMDHEVVCVEKDEARLNVLKSGHLPIYEPGLDKLFERAVARRRLSFERAIAKAMDGVDMVFLAVGTPSNKTGGIDLSQIRAAATEVARHAPADTVVVIKSSVTAGTARAIRELIGRLRGKDDLSVASNPEFLREGTAVTDFTNPDRIVIGADDEHAAERLSRLFAPFSKRGIRVITTSTVNAELIKYASNAFLALKIGFINEIADFCESIGADVDDVAFGIGSDRRIGPAFLTPGPGYGGSCLPKDTRAFAQAARSAGTSQRLIECTIRGNEKRKAMLADRIQREMGPKTSGKRIALLGLAFKAHTDDARESAALTIAARLMASGWKVAFHDPEARVSDHPQLAGAEQCATAYEAMQDAEAAVVLTDWPDYADLDLARMRAALAGNLLVDYRNVFNADEVAEAGLRYVSIGRRPVEPSDGFGSGKRRAGRRSEQAAVAP